MAQTFFRRCLALMVLLAATACSEGEGIEAKAQGQTDLGKTLIVYYSFTGNVRSIVSQLSEQGLIREQREANRVYYRANTEQLLRLADQLDRIFREK